LYLEDAVIEKRVIKEGFVRVSNPTIRIVEDHRFREWLSGIRPGVKPFGINGYPDDRLKRVTLERILREN